MVRGILEYFPSSIRLDQKLEDGQGLAEYALILALIAIVAVLSLIYIGGDLSTMLSNMGNSV